MLEKMGISYADGKIGGSHDKENGDVFEVTGRKAYEGGKPSVPHQLGMGSSFAASTAASVLETKNPASLLTHVAITKITIHFVDFSFLPQA